MKVYKYGLRPPAENEELIREQLRLAWEYRRDLTRLARARRAVERKLELDNGLWPLFVQLLIAHNSFVQWCWLSKEYKEKGRSRYAVPEDVRKGVAEAKKRRDEVVEALLSAHRKIIAKIKPQLNDINDRWNAMNRSVRRHYSKDRGLRHGTYTFVEAALSQSCSDIPLWPKDCDIKDPRWPEWDGTGTVGEQLQGGKSLEDISNSDNRCRIHHETYREPEPREGRAARQSAQPPDWPRFGKLWLRIGSDGKRSEIPIWGVWPIKQHRPIPPGARIKRVNVSLRREGPTEVWSTEVTVDESACSPYETCGTGMVAIDIGWRRLRDGQLRVAAWRDEDGNNGTVVLDHRAIKALRIPEELRRNRDKLLNGKLPALCDLLSRLPELPEWMLRMTIKRREKLPTKAQAIAHIAQWKSHARLRRLVLKWRDNRWEGDSEAYDLAESWRYRDHHLWEYETAQRNQALRRRRDQYRNFAAWIARIYKTVVMERFARRKVVDWPDEDEEPRTEQEEKAASWRQLASTHELAGKHPSEQGVIGQAVRARGGIIIEVLPQWTTQDCPDCGHKQRWDAAASIDRRPPCPECDCERDQDDGACDVLLYHAREGLKDPNYPRVARKRKKRNKHAREGESRWARVRRLRAEKEARKQAARKKDDNSPES